MMKKLLRAAFALAAGGATADVVDFADPMVGTAGTGHCSPAAAFPFGMVQPGADTGRAGWNYCAGYFYPDTTLVGFSQTHLNGTGSTDLGDLSIFPFTGERPAKFESRFSHERETASPGFYAVTLDDFGVRAEATCSKRIAYYRFTAGGPIRLFVDPTSVINGGENDLQTRVVKSELKVESDSRLTGFVAKKGWISRTLWYVVEADRPLALEDGVWSGTDKELKVRIALSAASLEGAKRNLASDRGTWDFDRIRAEARTAWRDCLGRVAIPEGTSGTVKRNLVTALYRLCLQPNLLSDAGEPPVYSTFSLWDTYRATHPLYCELFPEMVPDFVNSLLEQGRRTGYLPVWPLWGQDDRHAFDARHCRRLPQGDPGCRLGGGLCAGQGHADEAARTRKGRLGASGSLRVLSVRHREERGRESASRGHVRLLVRGQDGGETRTHGRRGAFLPPGERLDERL